MKIRVSISVPPVLPIRISGPRGTKEIDALLDTGATYCLVSRDDLVHLGYDFRATHHVPVATAGGVIRVPKILLASIEVAGFRRRWVPTLVKDLKGSGVRALVGWSFLDQFRLTIDARRKFLELSDR